jgi:hypothetical protein
MRRAQNPNLEILEAAVRQLDELADEMVFLGGCATGLLIIDEAAPPIRVTQDVDAIVQVLSRADYYRLSEKLRAREFKEDVSDNAPLCRWCWGKVILDVMPTDPEILGFGNEWYALAVDNSDTVRLSSGRSINFVSAPYFLVTKLEAFDGRGKGDYLLSHDIEDLIAVLDGRPSIVEEVRLAEPELAHELSSRFKELLEMQDFLDAVSGHLPADEVSQARARIVLGRIKDIAGIATN